MPSVAARGKGKEGQGNVACFGSGVCVSMLTKANTVFVHLSLYFESHTSQAETCLMDLCVVKKIVVNPSTLSFFSASYRSYRIF